MRKFTLLLALGAAVPALAQTTAPGDPAPLPGSTNQQTVPDVPNDPGRPDSTTPGTPTPPRDPMPQDTMPGQPDPTQPPLGTQTPPPPGGPTAATQSPRFAPLATLPAPAAQQDYPPCSRTVTDNCIQRNDPGNRLVSTG